MNYTDSFTFAAFIGLYGGYRCKG